jgi:hypothetical protein
MSDSTIAAIARQLAEALTIYAHERTSAAGIQAQKDIARLHWELTAAWMEEVGETANAVAKGEPPPQLSARFARGDHVVKTSGDYRYEGRIAFFGWKLDSNLLRYVVQDDRGLLLLMNEGQLRMINPEPAQVARED